MGGPAVRPGLPGQRPGRRRWRGRPAGQRRHPGPGRGVLRRRPPAGRAVPRQPAQPGAAGRRASRRRRRRPGDRPAGQPTRRAAGFRARPGLGHLLLADRLPGAGFHRQALRPGRGPGRRRPDRGRRRVRADRPGVPRPARRSPGTDRRLGRGAGGGPDDRPGGSTAGRADRAADHAADPGAGLPQRGRRAAAAGGRDHRDPRHQRGAGPAEPGHRRVDLRPEPDHCSRARPGHRLRAVHRPPVPGGAGRQRQAGPGGGRGGGRADSGHRRPHGAVLRPSPSPPRSR